MKNKHAQATEPLKWESKIKLYIYYHIIFRKLGVFAVPI